MLVEITVVVSYRKPDGGGEVVPSHLQVDTYGGGDVL